MLIDYHAHVNFNAYKNDADAVIARALEGGVQMVLVGSQIDTSERAVELANKFPKGVWAAVGLHPVHLEDQEIDEEEDRFTTRKEVFDPTLYRPLALDPKTVAMGETGIDYFHLTDVPKTASETEAIMELQKQTLRAHIALADETDLPLILHCRPRKNTQDAYVDMLALLEDAMGSGGAKRRGVIHCFLGNQAIAKRFITLGFGVGFTGIITFPNAREVQEVARTIPLESILVETDCPYLTPAPHRGTRNEPVFVRYVAEKIAELRGISLQTVEEATFKNSLRLFHKITS